MKSYQRFRLLCSTRYFVALQRLPRDRGAQGVLGSRHRAHQIPNPHPMMMKNQWHNELK
jgi:hypothetical protein